MNGVENKQVRNTEKQFPGCIGRMLNLFESGAGMTGKRLLTANAHHDCILSKSQAEATKKKYDVRDFSDAGSLGTPGVQLLEETRRNISITNLNGTPMKMLIAEEMSKEPEARLKPPSVVARLMGLDLMPAQQPSALLGGRDFPEQQQLDAIRSGYQQPVSAGKQMPTQHCGSTFHDQDQVECKDIYEVFSGSHRSTDTTDSSENGSFKKATIKLSNDHQKFGQGKEFNQSQEFEDALEVLGSNKNLFLKFLQHPSSFSLRIPREHQDIPCSPETKRITILKPSKTWDNSSDLLVQKHNQRVEGNEWIKSKSNWRSAVADARADNCFSQPTKIVVLKPITKKLQDIKSVGLSPPLSPMSWLDRRSVQDHDDIKELGEIFDENLQTSLNSTNEVRNRWFPSVDTAGYGDECSFDKSDCGCVDEGIFSDSEITTLPLEPSWGYNTKYDSSVSRSSFSQTLSSDSTVSREAKKRLSERWALIASNSNQEPQHHSKSSSTLGEMLSFHVKRKPANEGMNEAVGNNNSLSKSCGSEEELGVSSSGLGSRRDNATDELYEKLLRSKSVPASSLCYNGEPGSAVSHLNNSNSVGSVEMTKSKSGKSFFKGKVSSIFLSRNKKSAKEKSAIYPAVSVEDGKQSALETSNLSTVEPSEVHNGSKIKELALSASHCENSSFMSLCHEALQVSPSSKGDVLPTIPKASEVASDHQDQPSPVSVLEAPFEEEIGSSDACWHVSESPSQLHIVKSPETTAKPHLIESVACSLSWDVLNVQSTSPASPEVTLRSLTYLKTSKSDWFTFVERLLSAAGFNDERLDLCFQGWYSVNSPLDPELLDSCWEKGEDKISRLGKLEGKLIFDYVNAVLVELTEILDTKLLSMTVRDKVLNRTGLLERIWLHMKEWTSCRMESCSALEKVVREEAACMKWHEFTNIELNRMGMEIETDILVGLIDEALFELPSHL